MKMQRSTAQMKAKLRNAQDQLNEEEIAKLFEKQFRIMIVKMFQNLKNRMKKIQEAINMINTITKDIEETNIKPKK